MYSIVNEPQLGRNEGINWFIVQLFGDILVATRGRAVITEIFERETQYTHPRIASPLSRAIQAPHCT